MTTNNDDPITEYLIVNEEHLDAMGLGKCCAQVAHAAQMLQCRYGKLDARFQDERRAIHMSIEEVSRHNLYSDWLSDGIRKVVLKADKNEWRKLQEEFKEGDEMVLIRDAGHTKLEPGSETVIGLFPMRKSSRSKLLQRLQVL